MNKAKDRLIFPLDLADGQEAMRFVRLLREHVGIFKVGLELFISEGPGIISEIRNESDAGIFLDLKLHDIPATMRRAFVVASRYSPMFITVHCDEGGGFLKDVAMNNPGGTRILGVTVLTSLDSDKLKRAGFADSYSENIQDLVLQRAKLAIEAGCHGVVCSGHEISHLRKELGDKIILVTPGIRPKWSVVSEDDQKRIVTPSDAIKMGADYVVVGRPIRDAEDPAVSAQKILEEMESAL